MDSSSELPDKATIAADLVTQLETRGVTLRLFGSCAVWLLCDRARSMLRDLNRQPKDIDGLVPSSCVAQTIHVLSNDGWRHDEAIRAWSDNTRLRFSHPTKSLVLDVCIDKLRFAQTLDVRGRLNLHPLCLSQTDVLLSKLQIVRETRNDLIDLSALLYSFDLGRGDRSDLSLARVSEVTRASWRWSRGVSRSLAAVRDWSTTFTPTMNPEIDFKVGRLLTELKEDRHTLSWYCEAVVGRLTGSWFDAVEDP